MCGIAGILGFDGSDPAAVGDVERMAAAIAHRGPDDEGFYVDGPLVIGNRRLAVLGPGPAGHQPMTLPDGSLVVTHNGEIYNYVELRGQLEDRGHHFTTSTDTEVILHAFAEWGITCVDRFIGMFAFALWDVKQRALWLARDRLGVKPLHYVIDRRRLAFASEIKALRELPGVARRARAEGLAQHLAFTHSIEPDRTCFEDVRSLPPGAYGHVGRDGLKVVRWWDPIDLYRNPVGGRSGLSDQVRGALDQAVRLHVRSDVPIGAHLSGGLDSSLVVGLMSQQLAQPVQTFSGAFDEGGRYDERRFIESVVNRWHSPNHTVTPTADDFRSQALELAWTLDEPAMGAAAFSQFEVCRLVRHSGVTVVNGGQGGDEVFGGYPRYLLPLSRGVTSRAKVLVDPAVIKAHVRRRMYDGSFGRLVSGLHRDFVHRLGGYRPRRPVVIPEDPVADQMYFDLRHYLPAILHGEDRLSMAHSIESRVPLLDHRVVELAATIPASEKIPDGHLKGLLRQAVADVVPTDVLERTDKLGFPTPFGPWTRGPLSKWVRDLLLGDSFTARRVYSPQHLRRLLTIHERSPFLVTYPLWAATAVALWFEAYDPEPDW